MKNNRLVYILIIIILIWLGVLTFNNTNQKKNEGQSVINQYTVSGFSTDFTKIVEDVLPSVVSIDADSTVSSGLIYAQNDDKVYVLTTYHGISNANNINIRFASAYTEKGELLGFDPYLDLAVIEVITPYQMKPIKLGSSLQLKPGEFVINIGTPISIDYADSVELSMISNNILSIENNILVEDKRYSYYLHALEISGTLKNGYSGSPLINMNGELVGMNTMNLSNNFNFAILTDEIKIVADKIIKNEEYTRNNFGIKEKYVKDMYSYEKSNLGIGIDVINGMYVEKVKENSLAYQAGVRSGDIIRTINNQNIDSLSDYLKALYNNESENFTFTYLHSGEELSAEVNND